MLYAFLLSLPLAGVLYLALRFSGHRIPPDWTRPGLWSYSHYLAFLAVLGVAIAIVLLDFATSVWEAGTERTSAENFRVAARVAVGLGGGFFASSLLERRPFVAVVLFVAAIALMQPRCSP